MNYKFEEIIGKYLTKEIYLDNTLKTQWLKKIKNMEK